METITQSSPADAKIALFMRMFQCRQDVWARRFDSASSGKSGYSAACANEWRAGVCDKPKVKCANCRNRAFIPLSPETVRSHLRGHTGQGRAFAIAAYPIRTDDSCCFAGVDLSSVPTGLSFRAATAIRTASRRIGTPAATERAVFSEGFRAWWFFNAPIAGLAARDFVSCVLSLALEENHELGFSLFDRIFPSQGLLQKIGLGQPVPLPLQGLERAEGRGVFLDENMRPAPDQWRFLSELQTLAPTRVATITAEARRNGHAVALRIVNDESSEFIDADTSPLSSATIETQQRLAPSGVAMRLDNRVSFALSKLAPGLLGRLSALAMFKNPEFDSAERMRTSVYGIPMVVSCAIIADGRLSLPRGCRDAAEALLAKSGIPVQVDDRREDGAPLSCNFHGELRPAQKSAAKALLAHDTGVLSAGTAFGKTVLAAYMIAARNVSTLVLVNRRQLQLQWIERLSEFLGLQTKEIGRIGGGGKWHATGKIDVAVMQSLRDTPRGKGAERADADPADVRATADIVGGYGFVIVDECHGLPAPTFAKVVDKARARFILGMSATPVRRDGHHPIIAMQCGPVRHRLDPKETARLEPFSHVAIVRPTRFRLSALLEARIKDSARAAFSAMQDEIARDSERNELIVRDVEKAVESGRSPVILTDRKTHLAALADMLEGRVTNVVRLQGGMGKRRLEEVRARLAAIPDGVGRVIVATGPFLGEGFDDPRLDTLFLAMPLSWKGRLAQYAGRLHRLYAGKREVRMYDYADLAVPTLERMFNRRCEGYEAIGYEILMPPSMVSGWPEDVAVPIEPRWHEVYSETIRRLCRDGVDSGLAARFVDAAWLDIPPDARGAERARSNAEAFLWMRLETLEHTRGRFRLNGTLPIPFGNVNEMEIDLLDADAKLAIEIDGPIHFASEDAYRRDRRKDAVLQANGFMVLRFLASDVVACLGDVLDAIASHPPTRNPPAYETTGK